jgi:hypothetical protein
MLTTPPRRSPKRTDEQIQKMKEEPSKPRHPLAYTVVGIVALFYTLKFGSMVLFLVGFPILFVCLWIGGGGRRPAKIPNSDALIYIGVGLALVVGTILYVVMTSPAK